MTHALTIWAAGHDRDPAELRGEAPAVGEGDVADVRPELGTERARGPGERP